MTTTAPRHLPDHSDLPAGAAAGTPDLHTTTYRLIPGTTLDDQVLTTRFGELRLKGLTPGALAALRALAEGDLTEARTSALVVHGDGETGLLRWQMLRARLESAGLFEHAVHRRETAPGEPGIPGVPGAVSGEFAATPGEFEAAPGAPGTASGAPGTAHEGSPYGTLLARLTRVGRGGTALRPTPAGPARLTRHAVVRPADGGLVLQAPGSPLAVRFTAGAAPFLARLSDWTDAVPAPVLRLLATAGALAPGGPEQDPEATSRGSVQWDPVDLAFHTRTRVPASAPGYGGTYRHAERFGPLPVSVPPGEGERVPLPVPDLDAVAALDPPLTRVLEERTSVREHDEDAPLTLAQLGELLYRTVRIRSTFTGGDGQELADRPVPAGGSLHELDVYPLVSHVDGLTPGLYRYSGDRHELELVAPAGPLTAPLVKEARGAAMMAADPQVVLLVAARFGRVMWKYETVAYPLILKHVGVLYQTFYLVGTAMGLAVCGLGGGDTAAFAAATGHDPLLEGTVGELVLGSRPRTAGAPHAPVAAGD
ncbi:SagB family peptide dehydrogenase [Streptomyces sp. NPDC004111]|uniref:SagB family peptide dehydrogenase n=1 Tax=Streptomyces sp. NPDC004111 TaxID=3364690 RepID=UPI0036AEEBD9